jgi:spore maturation protein CgeB
MRFALFYHSLLSDWNHGNAHFLRGIASDLVSRGHQVRVYEPEDSWSRQQLEQEQGSGAFTNFRRAYPLLESHRYGPGLDLNAELDGVDTVIVHEWNAPELVAKIGRHRAASNGYRLLFHDTHHRAVTARHEIEAFDLSGYDGVLAYGAVLTELYLKHGWARRAWTWHEAADTQRFLPLPHAARKEDLVWIGNWGDGERAAELREFLIDPVRDLGLKAVVHGVRYPEEGRRAIEEAGIRYGGWMPNFRVPEVFSGFQVTVHVPRRPYARQLRGIPTIRPFEALACGIPLVTAPWNDAEHLFTPGRDYLVARDGAEMRRHLRNVLEEPGLGRELAEHGRKTILARHTCAHRTEELFGILSELNS